MVMTELEKELTEIIKQQNQEIALLKEQIQVMMKKMFGTSSEKSQKINPNQMSMFTDDFFQKQRQLRMKPMKKK